MADKENLSNILLVPSALASKPGGYEDYDLASLVGSYVKLGFPAKTPDGKDIKEHMWVKVSKVLDPETENNQQLLGTLDNDPVAISEYSLGDDVAFRLEEIEDYLV